MKLNFLNVLNKKSSPDEIAEQVAALEVKKRQCEKDRDQAKNTCKEIRGRTMCGEKIPPDVIRNTDRDYDDAVLNLEVVTDSIEELKQSLYGALEMHREEEERRLKQLEHKRNEEYEKVMQELARVKGRLIGLATGIYAYPEVAQNYLRSVEAFNFENGHPHFELFTVEKDRVMAELKHPTPSDIEVECHVKTRWLGGFNIADEHERILEKHRAKYKIEQSQEQTIEA